MQTVLLLCSLLLLLVDCKQDSPAEPTTPTGTWKIDGITFSPALLTFNGSITNMTALARSYGDKCQDDARIMIEATGSLTTNYAASCTTTDSFIGPRITSYFSKASWKLTGTTFTITYSDNSTEVFDCALTPSVLKLSQTADFNGNGKNITLTFQLSRL